MQPSGALLRILLLVCASFLVLVVFGPFLIPVPPLQDTVPPHELADPDSRFFDWGGIDVHYKFEGAEPPEIVLLHGFGASLYSWNRVLEPLSEYGPVLAYDRVAFGLTERPLQWSGENPYSPTMQTRLLDDLLNRLGADRVVIIGHSAGGQAAMRYYLTHPDRVRALILVAPAVEGGTPSWLHPLLALPQVRYIGPLIVRNLQTRGPELIAQAWHDPSKLDDETLALYTKPLLSDNWDRALWEFTLASVPDDLQNHLGEFQLPVLIITGDDDQIVPTEKTIDLSARMPTARLAILSETGHLPHEETPTVFLEIVIEFLGTLS